MANDVNDFLRELKRHGYEPVLSGAGHYILKDAEGKAVRTAKGVAISFSATPSDHRWRDNALAQLRRVGIDPTLPLPAKAKLGVPDEKVLVLNALRQRVEWALGRAGNIKEFIERGEQKCVEAGVEWFGDINTAYHAISSLRAGKKIRGVTVKRLELACEAFAPQPVPQPVAVEEPVITPEPVVTAPVETDLTLIEIAELVYTGLPLTDDWRKRAKVALEEIERLIGA